MQRRLVFVLVLLLAAFAFESRQPAQRKVRTAGVSPANTVAPQSEQWLPFTRNADGTFSVQMPPPPDARSRWQNPAQRVETVFPATFDGPVKVRSGVADVSARPLNANNTSAIIAADGSLIYKEAFPGCDVQYRCTEFKTEEFIIVRELPSPSTGEGGRERQRTPGEGESAALEFAWALDTNGLTPRITPAHSIELCDAEGVPRLRINPPDGKDASGARLEPGKHLQFALNDEGLVLRADVRGFALPLIIDPTWSSTGTMTVARYEYPYCKLADGRVLVAGGNTDGIRFASSEIYNPNTQVWSVTGNLQTARDQHYVTLLQTGNVIATGGRGEVPNPSPECELFNPATNQWTTIAGSERFDTYHNATRLSDGRVLVLTSSAQTWLISADGATNTLSAAQNFGRANRSPVLLADGRVLASGGGTNGTSIESEIYNPGNNMWTAVASMNLARSSHSTVLLQDGRVLVAGGRVTSSDTERKLCEIYNPSTNTWTNGPSLTFGQPQGLSQGSPFVVLPNGAVLAGPRGANVAIKNELLPPSLIAWVEAAKSELWLGNSFCNGMLISLNNGEVLINGSNPINGRPEGRCEIFRLQAYAQPQSVAVHAGSSVNITLTADSLNTPTFTVTQAPQTGSLSGTAPALTYTAGSTVKVETLTFTATDPTFGAGAAAAITIDIQNTAPAVTASASPLAVKPGDTVSFSATGSDADSDAFTYSWDFGDGSPAATEQNPTHTYSALGDYTATVTVSDPYGGIATASVVVHVGRAPTVRFSTSDVVGFVEHPFTFDASASSDPENAIVGYAWNFGDGSPAGAGQQITRVYAAVGTYTVTLTVTDAEGLSSTLTRQIEVLPKSQLGLFNSFVEYKVKWDRAKTDKDSLSFEANVNVGDAVIGKDTVVAVEIAGKRYEGTLDAKLRDKSANEQWQVVANTKKQQPGAALLKLKVKKTSLGAEFNAAGALAEGEDGDIVELDIPVKIEIAGRSFDLLIASEFKFSKNGTRASGSGEGP